MAEPTSCCAVPGGYCGRVDALFNLPGVHGTDVGWRSDQGEEVAGDQLVLSVETAPALVGCPRCGVLAASHRRRVRRLHDIPAFGAPVVLRWRVAATAARNHAARRGVHRRPRLAVARAKLTMRAA